MCTILSTSLSRIRGLSLVELVVFIAIVGVAVSGVLAALNLSAKASADPMTQKQALSIAEALLEEVQLQAFTYCDPDDPNAPTALSSAGCTGGAGGANDENRDPLSPEAGETRTGAVTPFDNVSDYMTAGGLVVSPISSIDGTVIAPLAGYSATISVAKQGIGAAGGSPAVPAGEALLINVTVTGPGSARVTLDGYRIRYAPNALP